VDEDGTANDGRYQLFIQLRRDNCRPRLGIAGLDTTAWKSITTFTTKKEPADKSLCTAQPERNTWRCERGWEVKSQDGEPAYVTNTQEWGPRKARMNGTFFLLDEDTAPEKSRKDLSVLVNKKNNTYGKEFGQCASAIGGCPQTFMGKTTYKIVEGYIRGRDKLSIEDPEKAVGVVWDEDAGSLTIAAPLLTPVALEEKMLAVQFLYTPEDPLKPSDHKRVVSVTVEDGQSGYTDSSPAARQDISELFNVTIKVSSLTLPPVIQNFDENKEIMIDLEDQPRYQDDSTRVKYVGADPACAGDCEAYVKQGIPVVLQPLLALFDEDSTTIGKAVVTVSNSSNSPVHGDELRATVNTSKLSVSGQGTHTLTLVASTNGASIEDFQAALRTVSFSSNTTISGATIIDQDRSIKFEVMDATYEANPEKGELTVSKTMPLVIVRHVAFESVPDPKYEQEPGERFIISVVASGSFFYKRNKDSSLRYHWARHADDGTEKTWPPFLDRHLEALDFKALIYPQSTEEDKDYDTGYYKCTVTNAGSSKSTDLIELNVKPGKPSWKTVESERKQIAPEVLVQNDKLIMLQWLQPNCNGEDANGDNLKPAEFEVEYRAEVANPLNSQWKTVPAELAKTGDTNLELVTGPEIADIYDNSNVDSTFEFHVRIIDNQLPSQKTWSKPLKGVISNPEPPEWLGSDGATSTTEVIQTEINGVWVDVEGDITVDPFTDLRLRVFGGGKPLPYFEWSKDGNTISNGPRGTTDAYDFASGADADDLTIHRAKEFGGKNWAAGSYRVLMHNYLGVLTSEAISVSVNLSPVQVQMQQLLPAGSARPKAIDQSYTISCSVAAASPAPTFQWFRIDSATSLTTAVNFNNTRFTVKSPDAMSSELTIVQVQADDEGSYTCRVENSACLKLESIEDGICADSNGGCSCQEPSPSRMTLKLAECIQGQRLENTTGKCWRCEQGQFMPDQEHTKEACEPCRVGQHQPTKGQEACINCKSGQFASKQGSPVCERCDQGQFAESDGSNQCDPCAQGMYNTKVGEQKCVACEAGQSQPATGSTGCEFCTNGTYSQKSAPGCINCPEGKFGNKEGATDCKKCERGMYNEMAGITACKDCEKGKYNEFSESKSDRDCSACAARMDTAAAGSDRKSHCVCEDMTFYKENNQTALGFECKDCPEQADCPRGEVGITLQNMRSLPGYWRQDENAETFYTCDKKYSNGSVVILKPDGSNTTRNLHWRCVGGTVKEQCANNTQEKCDGVECPKCQFCDGRGHKGGIGSFYVNPDQSGRGPCIPCPSLDEATKDSGFSPHSVVAIFGTFSALIFQLALIWFVLRKDKLGKLTKQLNEDHKKHTAKKKGLKYVAGPNAEAMASGASFGTEATLVVASVGATAQAIDRVRDPDFGGAAGIAGMSMGRVVDDDNAGAATAAMNAGMMSAPPAGGASEVPGEVSAPAPAPVEAPQIDAPKIDKPRVKFGFSAPNMKGLPGVDTDQLEAMQEAAAGFVSKAKILVTWAQCLGSFNTTFDIPWPPVFTSFVDTVYGIFSIDFMAAFKSYECHVQTNFFRGYIFLMLALPGLLLMIRFAFLVAMFWVTFKHYTKKLASGCFRTVLTVFTCKRHKKAAPGEDLEPWRLRIQIASTRSWQICFGVVFCLYPAICAKVFMVFNCEQIGEHKFLMKDPSVLCGSEEHKLYVALSCLLIVGYVIGIPFYLWYVLWKNKKTIQNEPDNPAIKAKYGSLYHQYEPDYWYFELVQMARKMCLTGGLMVFGSGSTIQVLIGILVCFFYLVLWINTKPYVMHDEDRLEQVAAVQLFVSLILGLILKYEKQVKDEQELRGFEAVKRTDDKMLDILLVFMNVVVIVFGIFTICLSVGFARKAVKKAVTEGKKKKIKKAAKKAEEEEAKKTVKSVKVHPSAEEEPQHATNLATPIVGGPEIEVQQPRPVTASAPEEPADLHVTHA